MAYPKYRGVEITDTYFSGPKTQIAETLTRSISAIMREDRGWVSQYVGIASGIDYWSALTRRVDNYKLSSGIKRVYLIYQSSSEQSCRELEDRLVAYYRERCPGKMLNRTGGGGGRHGSGPYFYVYLAVG